MSEIITTLHKKGDASVEVYPNVKASNIPNNAIDTSKIADASVTNSKLANDSISYEKIQDDAVRTDSIRDASVTSDKLASNSVNTSKIDDEAITTAKINDGAVTTDKIATGAVTTAKIATSSVTASKIANFKKYILNFEICEKTFSSLASYDIEILRIRYMLPNETNTITLSDFLSLELHNGFLDGYLMLSSDNTKTLNIKSVSIGSTNVSIEYIDTSNEMQSKTIPIEDFTTGADIVIYNSIALAL